MKCTDCGKELDGGFFFQPRFHGICGKCHEKFKKNYKKEDLRKL